jgi:hypothetical protein
MRKALFSIVALGFWSFGASANPPPPPPPLNEQTIVGVWEGLFDCPPAQVSLLWMDINPKGKSYLVWIWPGVTGVDGKAKASYHVYELLASDSKVAVGETRTFQQPTDGEADYFKGIPLKMWGTPVKLHFHLISPEPGIDDIWIEGVGVSSPWQTWGFIRCACCLGRDIWFVKGALTEDLGEASEHARDVIKQFAK